MTGAMRFHTAGGPGVLRWETVETPAPGPDEATIKQAAAGVNFIDIYHRTGLYPLPLPSGIGLEGAGVVEAVGAGVADLAPGDRVAYAGGPPGAYAERRNLPADRLVKLPPGIAFETAAAMMLRGLTAQYLLRSTYPVKAGDPVVIHAAAGGVGLIACQWARTLGATVIGVVGSEAKAALARDHGCDHVIVLERDAPAGYLAGRVRALTGGAGVPVVYDSVGRDTFTASLDCLAPRGLLVSYGNASGPVPPFDLAELSRRGSLYVTRPALFTYTARRADLLRMAGELFELVRGGRIRIEIGQTYPLRDAARAHTDLAARRTTGSVILTMG